MSNNHHNGAQTEAGSGLPPAELPEHIEEFLDPGRATCCAFNRHGTLLAVGCRDGAISVWDFETRGPAMTLKGHTSAVVAVGWTRDGRTLISGSDDQTVRSWDVLSGSEAACIGMGGCVTGVSVCRQRGTKLACVSLAVGPPALVNFDTAETKPLPMVYVEGDATIHQPGSFDNVRNCHGVFGWKGDMIFIGAPMGCIVVVSTESLEILDAAKVGSIAPILGLHLGRKGTHLLAVSERSIHLLEVPASAPSDTTSKLDRIRERVAMQKAGENGSVRGSKGIVKYVRQFSHPVNDKAAWKAMTSTHDNQYVIASEVSKTAHHIYMWNIDGKPARVLEGPGEGVEFLEWHPAQSILLALAGGKVYIWCKIYSENWSAFAPDFRELDQNTEYVEREDEFDVLPEDKNALVKQDVPQEDDYVDVLTVRGNSKVFSSDDEDDHVLMHLPVDVTDVADPCKAEADKDIKKNDAVQTVAFPKDDNNDGNPPPKFPKLET